MNKKNLNDILVDICILFLGIALVIWADKVTSIVSIILGIITVLYSTVIFVNYFRKRDKIYSDTFSFIYGIVLFVIGIILIFRVDFLKELISFIIGIYIILTSIVRLYETITVSKNNNIKLTSAMILAVIGIIVGILAITLKLVFPDIIIKYIGVLLVIYSIVNIINIIMVRRK